MVYYETIDFKIIYTQFFPFYRPNLFIINTIKNNVNIINIKTIKITNIISLFICVFVLFSLIFEFSNFIISDSFNISFEDSFNEGFSVLVSEGDSEGGSELYE